MGLKKNDVFTAEIIDITNLGFGVAKIDGQVIFISGAVTGDTVRARIIKVGSSYSVGRVEEFVKYSPWRTDDRCHNGGCRSCAYKCLSYEREKELEEMQAMAETASYEEAEAENISEEALVEEMPEIPEIVELD
jgi:23S rRNA (uracil1939-C5)-methyltransferase